MLFPNTSKPPPPPERHLHRALWFAMEICEFMAQKGFSAATARRFRSLLSWVSLKGDLLRNPFHALHSHSKYAYEWLHAQPCKGVLSQPIM
jgi:hypothetical protein